MKIAAIRMRESMISDLFIAAHLVLWDAAAPPAVARRINAAYLKELRILHD